MISKDEYLARADREDDWAPGWEAVDAAFERVYPGVTPPHLATSLPARAMFGGEEYLDGVSLYPSPRGYQHLVTYGISVLYVDEESFGGEESGWGYEMTTKVRAERPEDCHWAVGSLLNLARYTYTSKRWFEPYQYVSGRGRPLREGSDTLLTSYLVVPDTEVDGIDTLHGRVEFLQLVGITQEEADWVAGDGVEGASDRARELARCLAAVDPYLATDLNRRESVV